MNNIIKLLTSILLVCFSLFSMVAASQVNINNNIPEVVFSKIPIHTFKGKTNQVVLPISNEYTLTASAWNYPRVPDTLLSSDIRTGLGLSVDESMPKPSKVVKFTDTNEAYSSSSKLKSNLGYFNHLLCYSYNSSSAYFVPTQKMDSSKNCPSGQFTGNFLNWSTMTNLDLLRYGLTGGSRDIDTAKDNNALGITVLKKSRTVYHDELLYPSSKDFRDTLNPIHYNEASGQAPSGHKYAQNCGIKIYFSNDIAKINYYKCADLNTSAGALNIGVSVYEARVQVCNPLDASLRPDYCQAYPSGDYKPIGAIQKNHQTTRYALLSYVNTSKAFTDIISSYPYEKPEYTNGASWPTPTWNGDLYANSWGGVLRAPSKFVGKSVYDKRMNYADNTQQEWNADNGTLILDPNHKFLNGRMVAQQSVLYNNAGFPNGIIGTEPTSQGTSIINYINEFGYFDRYRNSDHFAELIGDTLRYISSYDHSYEPNPMDPLDKSSRQDPFYFYRMANRSDRYSLTNLKNAIELQTDTFPVVKLWYFRGFDSNKPIRTVCEKNDIQIVGIAEVNNWRQKILTNNGWHSSALGKNDDTFFSGKSLKDVMDEINPSLHSYGAGALSGKRSTELYGNTQNRYVVAALLAGANLYGMTYQDDTDIGVVKAKSTIIDVGDPELDETGTNPAPVLKDCHLFTAGIYGSSTLSEISDLVASGKTCANWAAARTSGNPDLIEAALPAKGYSYASSSNKIIDNILQAFKKSTSISGSLAAGAIQNNATKKITNPDGSIEDKKTVYVLKNNLEEPKGLDSAISTRLQKYELYSDNGVTKSRLTSESTAWENTLKSSLRDHANKNIILGGSINLDSNNSILSRNLPLEFTYTNLNTNNDTDAINLLSLGLAQKQVSNLTMDDLIQKRIEYIRGSSEKEQTNTNQGLFRARNNVIGSTSSSTPVYQAKFDKNGLNVLYIGGNDGMLHGINADSGEELFSFIPRNLLSQLYEIGEKNYLDNPLLESNPIIKSILPTNNVTTPKRKTILLSGYGGGAKGVFALDISRLHNSNSDKKLKPSDILFEFTEKDDSSIGNFVGQPEFVTLKTGTKQVNGQSVDIIETLAAITSGYNSYDPNSNGNSSFTYLYLLKTSKAYQDKWVEGVNYYKYKLAPNNRNNGLSAPAGLGFGGLTQNVYMGDLEGNLWKIPFNGNVNTIASNTTTLFKGQSGDLMPITAKPVPIYNSFGSISIFVGTGRYLGLSDLGRNSQVQQYLLGINDLGSSNNLTMNDLNGREIREAEVRRYGYDSANSKGWYIKLQYTMNLGERITNSVVVEDGNIVFATQMLGEFDKKLCGVNQSNIGIINTKTGLGLAANNLQDVKFVSNYLIGGMSILPPINLSSSTNYGSSSTSVNRSPKVFPMDVAYGTIQSASNENINTIDILSLSSTKRQGVLSWREIINNKIN